MHASRPPIEGLPVLMELRRGLRLHFGPCAELFVDPLLWIYGTVAIDLLRLDNWLQRRNPEYRPKDSMEGFIRRKFGDHAADFVKSWIRGKPREGFEPVAQEDPCPNPEQPLSLRKKPGHTGET